MKKWFLLLMAALLLCLPVWAIAAELDITGMNGEIAINTDDVTLTGASDKVWVVVAENVSSLTLKNCTIGANDEEQNAITFETPSSAVSKRVLTVIGTNSLTGADAKTYNGYNALMVWGEDVPLVIQGEGGVLNLHGGTSAEERELGTYFGGAGLEAECDVTIGKGCTVNAYGGKGDTGDGLGAASHYSSLYLYGTLNAYSNRTQNTESAVYFNQNIVCEEGSVLKGISVDDNGISCRHLEAKNGSSITAVSSLDWGIYAHRGLTAHKGASLNVSGGKYGLLVRKDYPISISSHQVEIQGGEYAIVRIYEDENDNKTYVPASAIQWGSDIGIKAGPNAASAVNVNQYTDEKYLRTFEKHVAQPVLPQTGDKTNLALWSVLAAMSIAGMFFLTRKKKEA